LCKRKSVDFIEDANYFLSRRMMQTPLPPSENLLRRLFCDGGPSARTVYGAVSETAIFDHELEVDSIIAQLTYETLKAIIEKPLNTQFPGISSKVIIVKPESPEVRNKTIISITSPVVAKKLLSTLRGQEVEKMNSLFGSLKKQPGSGVAVGMIFEQVVHEFFAQGLGPATSTKMVGSYKTVNIHYKALTGPGDNNFLRIQPKPRDVYLFHDPREVLNERELSDTKYYIPRRRNEPSFDSFLVETIDGCFSLTFFQISIMSKHTLGLTALEEVNNLLMEFNRPTVWRVVYVVPQYEGQRQDIIYEILADKKCGLDLEVYLHRLPVKDFALLSNLHPQAL